MNARVVLASTLSAWIGASLLLGGLRWMRRRPLPERIWPYVPGAPGSGQPLGVLSAASFREVLGPVVEQLASRFGRLLGVTEELAIRLDRIQAPVDVHGFRLRQLGWSAASLAAGAITLAVVSPEPVVSAVVLMGIPVLVFALLEHQVLLRSTSWQQRLFDELPIVAEQFGMLLSAGYSLGATLQRIASRGNGACATDLGRVVNRIQQGLSESEALREWAERARVDAVDRFVSVLALNREASDLGHLVSEEARRVRQEAHRRRLEVIERRSQQVWIPVTVAALVPGTVFLAVPFLDAMRLYGGG